ncbi:cellulose binding domain-containing protein [Micromonospora sp. NPDC049523]|uniref:cellulose binding domain-containing protein n=1 Tax=Micromonospora sp. NPDC049523 TaxID=3155921 RepID=UPI003427E4FF
MVETRHRTPRTARRPGRVPMSLLVAVAAAATLVLPVATARAAAADTQPPTVPGPIEIVDLGTTSVTLTWVPSTDDVGVQQYVVYHRETDMIFSESTPTNSITWSGLQPSRTYYFSVAARDAAGNRSPSTAEFRVTMAPGDAQPPTVPGPAVVTNLADTSLTLSWGRSTDNITLGRYEVLSLTPAGIEVLAVVPQVVPYGPRTTTTVYGLTPDTSYALAVRAGDEAGNYSAPSDSVTVTTLPPDRTPPTAPGTPVAATLSPSEVMLTWDPSTDVGGVVRYIVFDQAAPGGPAEVGRASTNWDYIPLVSGRSYTFVVYAEDTAGNRSGGSEPFTLTAPDEPPATCRVEYRILGQWPGAFQAEVTVHNLTPSVVDGWTLHWIFPATGQGVRQIWNAVADPQTDATLTVRNAHWNGRIAPNGSAAFGFVGSRAGDNPAPEMVTLNGTRCDFTSA